MSRKSIVQLFPTPKSLECESLLIPQQCSDHELSNKTQYPTFARTLPPSEKIAKRIIAVLKNYGWNRVVVVAGRHDPSFMEIKDAFEV